MLVRTQGRDSFENIKKIPPNSWHYTFAPMLPPHEQNQWLTPCQPAQTVEDRYHLLILDDIAYVSKDQAETSVLFELIAARYERRSMLITANQPFGEWGKIFPNQSMTLAAIDRLVHHATILEMNVESYRRREALDRKRGRGRPPAHATSKKTEEPED